MSLCPSRTPIKAMLWEEAKGKLRALVAVQGSYPSNEQFGPDWERLSDEVEKFIEFIEGEGLQE